MLILAFQPMLLSPVQRSSDPESLLRSATNQAIISTATAATAFHPSMPTTSRPSTPAAPSPPAPAASPPLATDVQKRGLPAQPAASDSLSTSSEYSGTEGEVEEEEDEGQESATDPLSSTRGDADPSLPSSFDNNNA
uniref:Predicted GPI-anchored protein 58 n=1 Tax=Nicotiana tabacum TaxID=4097 RepID=A0A1S4B1X5_TOBAC|nr:PREDICTED: predicted GPI-anchored protein 58 [Nicotiana tabacum]